MTRKEALSKAIMTLIYFQVNFCKSKEAVDNTQAIIDTLERIEKEPRWIPVSERLPCLHISHGLSDDVLITNGFEIDMGHLVKRGSKIFWHYYGSEFEVGVKDEDNDAIAWCELPKPYKGGEEECY